MGKSWHRCTGHKDETAAPCLRIARIISSTRLNRGCHGNPSSTILTRVGVGGGGGERFHQMEQHKAETRGPTAIPVKSRPLLVWGRGLIRRGGAVSSVTHWRTTYMLFSQEVHDLKVNMPGYTDIHAGSDATHDRHDNT